MKTKMKILLFLTMSFLSCVSGILYGQAITRPDDLHHPIPPRSRRILISPAIPVRNTTQCIISGVTAHVNIRRGIATTTLKISVYNPNNAVAEAEMLIPVPDGVVVKGMDFAGKAAESTAKIMSKEEALKQYREIVSRMRDPSIMEFVNTNMIRSAVFPVEARGKQMVSITYEQVLPRIGGRVDYILPRSESLDYKIPWDIFVTVDTADTKNVFSPSHSVTGAAKGKESIFSLDAASKLEPGAFMLSYNTENGKPMTFMYPDPRIDGGYFMIVGSIAGKSAESKNLNELILVLDRSGSMRGKLIKQMREAAKQALAALDDGVFFNIVMYNEGIDPFKERSIQKNEKSLEEAFAFIDSFNPGGGTNINDALVEALMKDVPPPPEKNPERTRSAVLFLTDGLPTIGQIREKTIRENVEAAAKKSNRAIFTFGVGTDVNAPLLDRIAKQANGRSTYVLPDENIEVKIGAVSSKIAKNAFIDPVFKAVSGKQSAIEIRSVFPRKTGSVYSGEQFVVLGEYRAKDKNATVTTVLEDTSSNAGTILLKTDLNAAEATTSNAFVPRLWAARKIAELTDAVRELGIDSATDYNNPKLKELTDEIIRLSMEYGILSEFTAYFATEGSLDMNAQARNADEIRMELHKAAAVESKKLQSVRVGADAVASSFNAQLRAEQTQLNRRNVQLDSKDMSIRGQASMSMNQMDNQSFVRNGKQWTQGTVLNTKKNLTPDVTIEFGSKDYDALIATLAKEKRMNALSLQGEILLEVDGKLVLVRNEI